jgi:hypothetical protein
LGGAHAAARHLELLLDCAVISRSAADFMLRESPLHARVCGVCAEACERCADSCEQFPDAAFLRRCAEVCRRCADSCYDMSQMSAAA